MGDFHSFPIICSINKTCVVSYANVARHSALPSVGLDGFSGDWKEELFFGSSWDGWRILQLTAPDVTFPVEYFFHSCLLAESPFLWHENLNLRWCDFIVEIDSIDSQSSKKFPPIDSFRFLEGYIYNQDYLQSRYKEEQGLVHHLTLRHQQEACLDLHYGAKKAPRKCEKKKPRICFRWRLRAEG